MASGTGRLLAERFIRFADARLHDAHRIPAEGPALLVGNHALLGLDTFPLTALIGLQTGRAPRFLGERNLWKIPGMRRLLDAAGAIPGVADDAVALLEAGEIVMVYPGGVDDSFKLSSEAYTLKWGERAGFARVAMRAHAPIVPFAGTGVDGLYEVRRREGWLGRTLFGSPRYDIPRPTTWLPRGRPLDYFLLPPIDTAGDATRADDVERVRRATHDAIESVLAPYRARHPGSGEAAPHRP